MLQRETFVCVCAWHTSTHKHTCTLPSFQVGRRWLDDVRCVQTQPGKHIIACSHLTCQNSRAPRLLVFGDLARAGGGVF